MELYIVRHAIAVPRGTEGYPHDDRPLTQEGIKKMQKAAKGLRRIVPDLDVILTSPMRRAEETAHIIAQELNLEENLVVSENLRPGAPRERILDELSIYREAPAVMLVGHEPDLSQLSSHLLGFPGTEVELKKGAVLRIDLEGLPPHSVGRLVFLLQPKHLRAIATS